MHFRKKIDSKEYEILKNYSQFLKTTLLSDAYISKKDYIYKKDEISNVVKELLFLDKKSLLVTWCKNNKTSYKKLKILIAEYCNTETLIEQHNTEYVKIHLKTDKDYLDNILSKDDPNIKLDEEQRKVVLSDEDYTLVVAGAGAGKTTTIEAKVKYLVEIKQIDPSRILIVSFTRKATDELKERFNKLEIPVNISTFHSIGNTIIKDNDSNKKHQIVNFGFMYKVIEEYLMNTLNDEYFIKKILLFFASYLNMPFETTNISLLFKSLSANDVTTLKSDVSQVIDDYHKNQIKNKITINNERVRSLDECRIANFLYIKGIDYVYEPVYTYGFDDTTKPYCPDFLIKHNGQNIYLEHFGISEDGTNNRFTEEDLELYIKHKNDKIKLHEKHGTKLIYTFSQYRDGEDLITHLEKLLLANNIQFDAKNDITIYRQIASKTKEKYFTKLIQLICNFINRLKVGNYDYKTKFDEWQYSVKSERTKLFLEIVKNCFYIYETKRNERNAVDFEDMINDAIKVLDQRILDNDLLPYDYILVDEYQDISLQRFDLCEKLSKASAAKIIAVGDDWQSIFRFSGAQINLFTKFEEKMGYANVLKITKTYRNSQELIDIAGGFVMKNQMQIKKDLKSNKSIKDPVILMSYDDTYEKDDKQHGPFYRLGEAIQHSLDDIVAKNGIDKTVFLIGRYNFDGKNLSSLTDFFYWSNNKIKSKKYPELNITFMTAHSSKGLGADNIIIINGKDSVLGFPSKIEDDPVMKLVINDDESIDYEEERRLFYVALTRTKNRVYIITPQNKPSKFIIEIKNSFQNVILRGAELNPRDLGNTKYKCPVCGYPLQKRSSNFKFLNAPKNLWICSNDPEICGFLTNDLNGNKDLLSISKCPSCHDGYLIIKAIKNKDQTATDKLMLGCTNYKQDGTGCNASMFKSNYTQDKSKILIDEKGRIRISNVKSEINAMLSAIYSVSNQLNFNFNSKTLLNFVMGKEDKVLSGFHLPNKEGYGIFKNKEEHTVTKIINALYDLDILEKIKKDKFTITLIKQDSISDNQLFTLKDLL